MGEIPSMWRKELLHPLFVHFPIGLLLISALVGLAAILFRKKSYADYLSFTFSTLLFIGVAFFWLTFYTGQMAYSIEVRKICDPTVLKDHLYWAYFSGYVFSIGACIEAFRIIWKKRLFLLFLTTVAFSLGGSVTLAFAGHLGAKVVYQQGAGVYKPTTDCHEFE